MNNISLIVELSRASRVLRVIVLGLILTLSYGLLFGNSAVALNGFNRLEQIGFSTMPGNRVQIQLNFAETAINPTSFSTDNPARIVLDFADTTLGLRKKSQPIGIGVVQSTSAVATRDRARIVINLIRMVPFNITVEGQRVLISIENSTSQTTTLQTHAPSIVAPIQPNYRPQAYQASSQGAYIEEIDFRRTRDGAGRVAITLSAPSMVVDMGIEGQDIVLKFPNTQLPEKLDRRLDVVDFATQITFIDTKSDGPNVRMNITVKKGDYEHHAYRSNNVYIVEVKEKIQLKMTEVKIEERKYKGKAISFDFQNIEVRAILSLLFDLQGDPNLNFITSDQVGGSVTLRLKNVPWDQALDIILETRGLGMRKIGNVVMFDLKTNIDARKQRDLKAQKEIKQLEPVRTEFIVINYAKASDIVSLLKTSGKHSFLSNRGAVSMDQRTNTLIIKDTATKIAEIRQLIASLDTPVRQVLIESRIVIATSNFSKALGVKFGYGGNEGLGTGKGLIIGGRLEGETDFGELSQGFVAQGGGEQQYLVNLPAVISNRAAIGLAVGKMGSYLLELELSAMQTEGSGEVLSNPRIITGNQQEATITQGTEIAYTEPGGVGVPGNVQFKPAVLELKVTPQITPDDRIILDLNVKKDSPTEVSGTLSIEKREIKTNVLVDNGETVVLGGVYEESSRKTLERVPFFSDLPLVGNLFKRRSSASEKSELLIFVTPRIIKEN